MLKIKPITNKIIHVTADNQEELCATMVRFSEYVESPEFAGKIFTLGQFRKWYAETYGAYSFLTDWSGFNLTQDSFVPFVRGLFDPLTPNEQTLVNWIKDRTDKFSVIGTYPGSDAFEHEVCHALWATEPEYKNECHSFVDSLRTTNQDLVSKMEKIIADLGYGPGVLDDEIHAYLSANPDWLLEKKGLFVEPWITEKFRSIKMKYAPKK